METKASDILLSLNSHNLEVWKAIGDVICVQYMDSYIKNGPILEGTFGRGETFEDACHDYLTQIQGKTLVFNVYDEDGCTEVTVLRLGEEKDN